MSALAIAALVAGALMGVCWLVSLIKRDASIVDPLWPMVFVAIAWSVWLWGDGAGGGRTGLMLLMVSAWGVRLGAHLTGRKWGEPEDFRYQAMRRRLRPFWLWSILVVFVLQGVLAVVVALPGTVPASPARRLPRPSTVMAPCTARKSTARLFRRQRDHSHGTCGHHLFKLVKGSGPYEGRVLRAGKFRAEERPLQVNTEHARACGPVLTVSRPRRFHIPGRVFDRCQRSRSRRRNRGRVESGNPVPDQETAHLFQALGRSVHDIAAGAAVNVNVNKTGQQRAAACVQKRCIQTFALALPVADQSIPAGESETGTGRRRYRSENGPSGQAGKAAYRR